MISGTPENTVDGVQQKRRSQSRRCGRYSASSRVLSFPTTTWLVCAYVHPPIHPYRTRVQRPVVVSRASHCVHLAYVQAQTETSSCLQDIRIHHFVTADMFLDFLVRACAICPAWLIFDPSPPPRSCGQWSKLVWRPPRAENGFLPPGDAFVQFLVHSTAGSGGCLDA